MQLSSDSLIKDDLAGAMSIRFKPESPLNEFLEKHIEQYNAQRFEVLAVRVYYGKELIVTVYAVDKMRIKNEKDTEKIPVKKFKLEHLHLTEIFQFVDEFNFTLSTGAYPLSAMEVENK